LAYLFRGSLFAKLFPKSSRKVLLPSAKFEDAEHHGNKPVLTKPMASDKLHEPVKGEMASAKALTRILPYR
jgi:hypothetical protein